MSTGIDNHLVRVCSDACHDDGVQQQFEAFGRKTEKFGSVQNGVPRVQGYGNTTHPPKGSFAYAISQSGNPDCAAMIGFEHPDYRPTKLKEGEQKHYDMWGNYCHMKNVDGARRVLARDVGTERSGGPQGEWEWNVSGVSMIMKNGVLTIKCNKVVLDVQDKVYLGGADASRPVAAEGTTDDDSEGNGNDTLSGNFLTKVVGK